MIAISNRSKVARDIQVADRLSAGFLLGNKYSNPPECSISNRDNDLGKRSKSQGPLRHELNRD